MPDASNPLALLKQREIEAGILKPVVEAMAAEFGRERVVAVLRRTIEQIATEHGQHLAMQAGRNDMAALREVVSLWERGHALELTVLQQDETHLDFNVTRCKFAEMYRQMGMEDLGGVLSCGRDFCLAAGFNPKIKLRRTQTIMEGAECCDFRFRVEEET